MTEPPVSVILPVYDGEKYLAQAIDSILAQTFQNFEFLIIDDGSTDRSLEIIEGYARRDTRIQVTSRANRGLIATLNEGIALARGEYVARMDADDVALPERLQRQVEFLAAHPRCVLVGASFVYIDSSGNEGRAHHCFINDLTIRHALPVEGCVLHPVAMFRRSAVVGVGGYKADYVAAEEYDLWHRLAHVGELTNLPEPLLYYREWDQRVSARHAAVQRRVAERIRDEIWNDPALSRYRRMPLGVLAGLPGEHRPALESLQKNLAKLALRHREIALFIYLCWDLVRFRVSARRRGGAA
jgi:glycosyltransferase involved in cell wall biosynthesis